MLCALTQGLFLTYYDFVQSRQILIRLQNDGVRVREDSLDLPDVVFAYGEGQQAKLVTMNSNPWTRRELFAVNAYDGNGQAAFRDTLLSYVIPLEHMHGGHALEYSEGVLTLVSSVVRTDVQPLQYRVTVVRCLNRTTTAYPSYLVPDLPAGTNLFAWTVTRGLDNMGLLGFYVGGNGLQSELRFTAFNGDGQPVGGVHTIPVGITNSVNGLRMLVQNNSVYACYTTQTTVEDSHGGAYAAGFPLPAILPADPRPVITVPSQLQMTAYPNPFNSSVRISYELNRPATAELTIVDLTGREVASFYRPVSTDLHGEFSWTAESVSSGVYFARFKAGPEQSTIKLMLIR
jgi:hypothetical protein